jgi:hypothetical protein
MKSDYEASFVFSRRTVGMKNWEEIGFKKIDGYSFIIWRNFRLDNVGKAILMCVNQWCSCDNETTHTIWMEGVKYFLSHSNMVI